MKIKIYYLILEKNYEILGKQKKGFSAKLIK